MLELNRITLFALNGIDGQNDHEQTLRAISYSKRNIKFARCLFLTSYRDYRKHSYDYSDVEVLYIKEMSYRQYNEFMVLGLRDLIDTDFVLTIQSDGFVLDHKRWEESFMDYDYIGAPWNINSIGNGGFSLRSKKFLSLSSLCYPIDISVNQGVYNEDTWLCLCNKEKMHGVKFAPIEMACKFSIEKYSTDGCSGHFGFHGLLHKQYIDLLNEINIFEIDGWRKKCNTLLLQQYYISDDPKRNEDLKICLKKNIENKNIDLIVLFVDSDIVDINNEKIIKVFLDRRAKFRDFVCLANHLFEGKVCIVANSDIYFDDSLELLLSQDNLQQKIFCISRKELTDEGKLGKCYHNPPSASQDAWSFLSPLRIPFEELDIYLGIAGCDNQLAFIFNKYNYTLVNPYYEVNAVHVHKSDVRDWFKYANPQCEFLQVEPTLIQDQHKKIYIECIIVCIGSYDTLDITLPKNKMQLDYILVVTDKNDLDTIEVCSRNGVDCLQLDTITNVDFSLDKSLAINEGYRYLTKKGAVLLLDVGTLLPDDFFIKIINVNFSKDTLYGSNRYICKDWSTIFGCDWAKNFVLDDGNPSWFFQLFFPVYWEKQLDLHSIYYQKHNDESIGSDFYYRFENIEVLDFRVLHICDRLVNRNGGEDGREFPVFSTKQVPSNSVCVTTLVDIFDISKVQSLIGGIRSKGCWNNDIVVIVNGAISSSIDSKWFMDRNIKLQFRNVIEGLEPSYLKYYVFDNWFKEEYGNVLFIGKECMVLKNICYWVSDKNGITAVSASENWKLLRDNLYYWDVGVPLFDEIESKFDIYSTAFNASVFSFRTIEIPKNTLEELIDMTVKYKSALRFEDQTAMNLYFNGAWEKAPLRFNIQMYCQTPKGNSMLLTFNGDEKPWDEKSAEWHKIWLENIESIKRTDNKLL